MMPDNIPQKTWKKADEFLDALANGTTDAQQLAAKDAQIAALQAKCDALAGVTESLIRLAIDGGLTHDLLAQLYPDCKNSSGQPALQFAKRAQREINEARAALAQHKGKNDDW
jgi:hypothetical protein